MRELTSERWLNSHGRGPVRQGRAAPMSELLRKSAVDYLLLRSLRGYQPGDQTWLIRDYLDFLDQHGFSTITVTNALAWACLPVNTRSRWRNQRLAIIGLFAAHIHASAPDIAELIPPGLLPARVVRAAPYLYSSSQVDALIGEAGILKPALQGQRRQAAVVAGSRFDADGVGPLRQGLPRLDDAPRRCALCEPNRMQTAG